MREHIGHNLLSTATACTFTTVPAQDANQVLNADNASLEGGSERFTLDELVVSTGCNLMVLTGTGTFS